MNLILQAIQTDMPVTPQSWGAWAGLFFGFVSCAILVFDRIIGRGRSDAKMDAKISSLNTELRALKVAQKESATDCDNTLKVMDSHLKTLSDNVRMLTYELKGVDGQNGLKGVVRQHSADIKAIHERNRQMDILAAIYKRDLEYRGEEKREGIKQLKERLDGDT